MCWSCSFFLFFWRNSFFICSLSVSPSIFSSFHFSSFIQGSKDGSIHFAGSAVGPSIKDEEFEHESRYLATKEFDIQGGGVVEYFVRYNDPEVPGGKQCKDKVDFMLKEFARQKRCEDEKKSQTSVRRKSRQHVQFAR